MNGLTNTGLIEVGNIIVKFRRTLIFGRGGRGKERGERDSHEITNTSQVKLTVCLRMLK